MKKVAYCGEVVRHFKAQAKHLHVSQGGVLEYWGDGRQVLVVNHSHRNPRRRTAEIFEAGDTMWHGGEFRYQDYFLSPLRDSEIGVSR